MHAAGFFHAHRRFPVPLAAGWAAGALPGPGGGLRRRRAGGGAGPHGLCAGAEGKGGKGSRREEAMTRQTGNLHSTQ